MFCFNFNVTDESSCPHGESPEPPPPAAALNWQPCHMLRVSPQDWEALLSAPAELEEQTFGNVCIKYLRGNFISEKLESSNQVSSAIKLAEEQYSDLIPAVYEGGLKVWECTWDLLQLLHTSLHLRWPGKRVLELGCGAGLLGISAFLCGASVTFQDYNVDVLEQVTVPNVLYNTADVSEAAGSAEAEDGVAATDSRLALPATALQALQERVRFCYGDWGSLPQLLAAGDPCSGREMPDLKRAGDSARAEGNTGSSLCAVAAAGDTSIEANLDNNPKSSSHRSCGSQKGPEDCTESKFDVILTSETIYNQENYQKLLQIFISCLQPDGVVLLAAKSCYFGVGGSVAAFLTAVERTGRLQHSKLSEHTAGVRREIIEIKLLQ